MVCSCSSSCSCVCVCSRRNVVSRAYERKENGFRFRNMEFRQSENAEILKSESYTLSGGSSSNNAPKFRSATMLLIAHGMHANDGTAQRLTLYSKRHVSSFTCWITGWMNTVFKFYVKQLIVVSALTMFVGSMVAHAARKYLTLRSIDTIFNALLMAASSWDARPLDRLVAAVLPRVGNEW